ncbi:MAG: spore coat protein [Bacillota bacterium]|nr:spore coat protein [Bacillota bacterium]
MSEISGPLTDIEMLNDYRKDAMSAAQGYLMLSMETNDIKVRTLLKTLSASSAKSADDISEQIIKFGGKI